MSVTQHLAAILAELAENQRDVHEDGCALLVQEILAAPHVFVAGAGRSGLAVAALANRLTHLGKSTSRVGDITSPHSRPGDLLVLASGSGATASLVAVARLARISGARTALVTMDNQWSIAAISHTTVVMPGVSPKSRARAPWISVQADVRSRVRRDRAGVDVQNGRDEPVDVRATC
jgi:6-phospho-3-hexuloisomerase